MTGTPMTPILTIPLEGRVTGGADIEILRAETRTDISSPLALIRYSDHGLETKYGVRLDLDKKAFIDHLEDVQQEGVLQQIAHELAGLLNNALQEIYYRQLGYVRQSSAASPSTTNEQPVKVAEAGLAAGKRQEQHGGVKVYSRATETSVEASVNLREEPITVEDYAVDRSSSRTDFADAREGTIRERMIEVVQGGGPVVAREARIVEEVVVGKSATERTETIHDTLRRSDVEVEQISSVTTYSVSGTNIGR